MKDYFDRLIRDPEHLSRCVRYVQRNPEKAQLRTDEFILYESPLAQAIT
jgi:putative transposase